MATWQSDQTPPAHPERRTPRLFAGGTGNPHWHSSGPACYEPFCLLLGPLSLPDSKTSLSAPLDFPGNAKPMASQGPHRPLRLCGS